VPVEINGPRGYEYRFMWRSSALGGGDDLLGPETAPQTLADEMHSAWVDYAMTGDPDWPRSDRKETEYQVPAIAVVAFSATLDRADSRGLIGGKRRGPISCLSLTV
jgi:hypothetical protein